MKRRIDKPRRDLLATRPFGPEFLRRGRPLLRVAVALAVMTACRGSHAVGPNGATTGTVDPGRVDPAFESDWQAVRDAQTKDPGSQAVAEAADRLLAKDPPLNLRLAAHQAKAGQGLTRADYAGALASAREGIEEIARARAQNHELDATERELAAALLRSQALAEAEAGDPQAALQAIAASPEADRDPLLLAANARARARLGDRAAAALAYAQWRSAVPEGSPAAVLAEARLKEQLIGLDTPALEAAARKASGTPAAQCLLARTGRAAPEGAPAWVSGCAQAAASPGGPRIGLLLPRTGKFAGLSDIQLAAAAAAVRVLAGASAAAVQIAWKDAGSSPAEARQAAQALIGGGAELLVGPVGPGNVEAAAEVVAGSGGRVRLVVPGEGSDNVAGVAPTIEARAGALAQAVGRLSKSTAIVFAPDNAYGKRAVAALEKSLPKNGVKTLKTFYYPPGTTSFAKVLDPARSSLKDAAVIIPDQLSRAELVVRQLVRDGFAVDRPRQPGVPVLSTAEGVGPDTLGVLVAPVAWPTPEAAGFAETYTAMEGEAPGDQAWLVWRAVARAWSGVDAGPPTAAVLRVESGRLVATEPTVSLTPEERPKAPAR
jgi:branched-chain amino acid transport system substrate-binding protein